jgi:hypothetical protein
MFHIRGDANYARPFAACIPNHSCFDGKKIPFVIPSGYCEFLNTRYKLFN